MTYISIKKETDRNNTEFTEKFLKDTSILIDCAPFETEDYIRCKGMQIEQFEGRWRLAFVHCPKCREYINVYKDEINSRGRTIAKKHMCGFYKSLLLKNW